MAGKCDLPLHGLTVVIDTPGERLYLGRYDSESPTHVVLRDARVHDLQPGEDKDAVLARCVKYGVFTTHDRVDVPQSEVVSMRRFSEIAREA